MSWQSMLGVGTAIVLLIARSIRKSIRKDKEAAEKQDLARKRAAIEALAQAARAAQELKARQEQAVREEAERVERNRRIALANSISEMHVTAVGDLITICRCRGFFMQVEVDPVRRDVACKWRFDLWKGAIHKVDIAYCNVGKLKDQKHSFETHDEGFRRLSAPLSSSDFRKDRRVVRGLSGGRAYTFRFTVTSNKAWRVFHVDAYVPADPSEYVEQNALNLVPTGDVQQQSRMRQCKQDLDLIRTETRKYINEVKSNPDLTAEEKDEDVALWEMIQGHKQRIYLRNALGIDVTGDA